MKNLLELIKSLYGSKAIASTIGSKTNVIRLPSNKLQKYVSKDLNIYDDIMKNKGFISVLPPGLKPGNVGPTEDQKAKVFHRMSKKLCLPYHIKFACKIFHCAKAK